MHKPLLASAGIYRQGKGTPSGAAPGGRTMAAGHTTTSLRLVSKCALSEISDKAHYPRRKIIREVKRKSSKIKVSSKNFPDYFSARFYPVKTETVLLAVQNERTRTVFR